MKCKFLINPMSGRGKLSHPQELDRLKEWFESRSFSFDYVLSKSRADLIQKTQHALRDGYQKIVAVGGDGTVNAVVNGFFENGKPIRPDAELAVAKMGTGSDYFKSIEKMCGGKVARATLNKSDWKECVISGKSAPVDLVHCSYSPPKSRGEKKSVLMANIAGIGMSPEIVRKKEKNPSWLPHALGYALPTLTTIPKFRAQPLIFDLDGEEHPVKLMAGFISKGSFAGGGMKLGGQVSLDDGKLGILLIPKLSMLEAFARFRTLYSGGYADVPGITYTTAQKITVRSDSKKQFPAEIDGEYTLGTPFEFTVMPKAIRVCIV